MKNSMRYFLPVLLTFFVLPVCAQKVITADIDRFWAAYDQLAHATTFEDSLRIIQEEYINQASDEFSRFMRLRNYSAKAYVASLGSYPKFWKSVRPLTTKLNKQTAAIDSLFIVFREQMPDFKEPVICFGIGTLNSAGTQDKGTIFISAEMVAADSTVVTAELSPWLQQVLGGSGNTLAMVAHESMHAQQSGQPERHLLSASISEGAADFLTYHFSGLNINQSIHAYGLRNECRLWKQFRQDMKKNPAELSSWLYNGEQAADSPADLGYFIGYRIAEAFYQQEKDKEKAVRFLLNSERYKKVFRKSGYAKKCR